jgi:Tfp pilus assembly protein FimT
MIDLTLALALAMLLVTASAAGFRRAQMREQIDNWTRAMSADISFGQLAAVADRTPVTVTLTTSSYLVATSAGTALRYAALPADIAITTTCPANACGFDHRGVPTAAGTITLTSASTGQHYVVTILPNTGRVSYQ